MGTFSSLEEAAEYFRGDRFALNAGIRLDELSDDACLCSMKLTEDHRNAIGGVMGGAIFTLADFAFAVLCNHRHKNTVALTVTIEYFSQPKGEELFARATCRKDGRTTCVYNVDVSDDTGRDVAQFIGTGYKL
jgi:acyl-CoA thioesterase